MKLPPVAYALSVSLAVAGAQDPAPTAPAKGVEAPATPHVKRPPLKYLPPKTAATGARLDGDGGSRAAGAKLPALYVLTPNHAAQTSREQPSLFWFQSAPASTRFKLTLVEPKNFKPVLKVESDKADRPGIHRITLAKHQVHLKPGVIYKWSVALVPDASSPSQDVIASGNIIYTPPDPSLVAALAEAKGLDRAALYASHGIWYDALEAVTEAIDADPKSKELHQQRAALLEQVGLKDAAAADLR